MKSWKKRLNEEFDKAAPALNDEVLNAPIITAQPAATPRSQQPLHKKGGWFACGMAVALAAIFVTLGVLGVFDFAPHEDRYVFALEINPAVSFITDADGNVLEVKALNSDADIVLSNSDIVENNIQGKPLSEAIVTYTDYAAQLGFLKATEQSAVRLSASNDTNKNLFGSVSASLTQYFKDKGIYAAVVEDKLDATEFAQRLGVEGMSLSEIATALNGVSDFFAERNVNENTTQTELEGLYKDFVVGNQFLEAVKNELVKNVESISTFAERVLSLVEIYTKNTSIIFDINNPTRFLFAGDDYWTLKEKHEDYSDFNGDFEKLMSGMDTLVADFETRYNQKLESYSAFEELYESIKSVVDSLHENLTDFFDVEKLSLDNIQASLSQYISVLKNVNVKVDGLESLLSVPTTVEAYFNQLQVSWQQVTADRLAENEDSYNSNRKPISDADYDAFINQILQENGSLENFWKNN